MERRSAIVWCVRLTLSILLAAGLVLAVFVAVDRGWQRERLVRLAEDAFRTRLGMDLSIRHASGRFTDGLLLTDVRIGRDGDPLFTADRLSVEWNPRDLVLGLREAEIAIERVVVDGWHLRLERSEQGDWEQLQPLLESMESTSEFEQLPGRPEPNGELAFVQRILVNPGRVSIRPSPTSEVIRWNVHATATRLRLGRDETPSVSKLVVATSLANPVEEPIGIHVAEAALRLEDERIREARVSVEGSGFRFALEASGTIDDLERVRIEADVERLRNVAKLVDPNVDMAGRVHAIAELSGPPDALVGSCRFDLADLEIGDVTAERVRGDLTLQSPLSEWPPAPLRMQASGSIESRGVDLGTLRPDWIPKDRSALDFEGRVADGTVDLRALHLAHAGLALDGQLKMTADRIEDLRLSARLADLDRWTARLQSGLTIAGSATASIRASGPLESLEGAARLRTEELAIDGEPVDDIEIHLERPASTTEHDSPAEIVFAWGPEAEGIAHARASVDLDARNGSWAIATTPEFAALALGDPAPPEAEFDASGTAAMNHESMEIVVQEITATARSLSLALEEPARIGLSPDSSWSAMIGRLRIARTHHDGAGVAPGHVELTAAGSGPRVSQLASSLDGVPADVVAEALGNGQVWGGTLSGQGSWTSTGANPGSTAGNLSWSNPRVGDVEIREMAARWQTTGRQVDAALSVLATTESTLLSASLTLPLPAEATSDSWRKSIVKASLTATIEDLEVSVLNAIRPLEFAWLRQPEGRLDGRLDIENGETGARSTGWLSLTGGAVSVPVLGRRFHPVTMRATLEGDTISVERLEIGDRERFAHLHGQMQLRDAEAPSIDATLDLQKFPLARSPVVTADVDGRIRLRGSPAAPLVRGELMLSDASIQVPSAGDPVLKEIRLLAAASDDRLVEERRAAGSISDRSDIEVTLAVPPSTRIRGQGAHLFVEGEATATKRAGEAIRLNGEANVVSGTYTFQGRRFRVRRGRATLVGDEKIDPLLDIEATLPVNDIVAVIEMGGRLSEPTVALRSEPERSEQDVLAYILFGRPASEVGAAQGGRFDAAAARLLAGVAERELRDVLGDAMPVDSIEIGADEEGNTSELGFGKYLGPRIYLNYVHVLGDEPADRVGVEYRVNDMFSVGSSVSTTGDAGVDLILRHDF